MAMHAAETTLHAQAGQFVSRWDMLAVPLERMVVSMSCGHVEPCSIHLGLV